MKNGLSLMEGKSGKALADRPMGTIIGLNLLNIMAAENLFFALGSDISF